MIFSIKHREKKMDYSNKAQHNYIGSETLVLLWNGTSKKANEIMVGDMIVTECIICSQYPPVNHVQLFICFCCITFNYYISVYIVILNHTYLQL